MARFFRLRLSSPPSCSKAGAALHAIALGDEGSEDDGGSEDPKRRESSSVPSTSCR
uniref:Uncharacterized protein n=1 Tax=Oryza sativa subsp. japonica TaxID=39947 RepID=Q6Z0W8_ORYSJ|nr:hypothetical protein [Oryza sativa Japonica Group]